MKELVTTYRGVEIFHDLGYYTATVYSGTGGNHHIRSFTIAGVKMQIGGWLKRGATAARKNPPLVAFANPGRKKVAQLSARVFAVQYRHTEDRKDYQHKFGAGVCMELLSDGSVRLYHKDGKPLFGEF